MNLHAHHRLLPMTRAPARRLLLALLLLAGCSASPGGPDSEMSRVAVGTDGPAPVDSTDAGPTGPFDITIASSPPIELAGTALWLDADFGVARQGTQARAWTDRSGHGLVFEREAVDDDPGPTFDRLGNHAAVHFGGHSRMVLTKAIDDKARAALTIGTQDFLVAVVFLDRGSRAPAKVFALTPRLDPDIALPLESELFLALSPRIALTLLAKGDEGTVVDAMAPSAAGPHLLVARSQGASLALRLDGKDVGTRPLGRLQGEAAGSPPVALPFSTVYLGEWDFDQPGLTGLVGDVVMVVGAGVDAAVAPLESYLRQKYGI